MADASQNKPKKEFIYAIVGVLAFLGVVLLIAVSGFLRPAGEHVEPGPAADEVVVAEETATDGEEAEVVVETEEATAEASEEAAADSEAEADTAEAVAEEVEATETETENTEAAATAEASETEAAQ